jgi:hypothetical protein
MSTTLKLVEEDQNLENSLKIAELKELICKETGVANHDRPSWKKEQVHEIVAFYDPNYKIKDTYPWVDCHGEDKHAWWPIWKDVFGGEPGWDSSQERTHNQPTKANLIVILKAIRRTKRERMRNSEHTANLMFSLKALGLDPIYDTISQEVRIQ